MPAPAAATAPPLESSMLARAARILYAFTTTTPELSMSDVVRRTGLPRSSVHRIMDQLVRLRALERTGSRYRLGLGLLELGALAAHQNRLRETALPHLRALHAATGAMVHLAVLDGHEIVYLEKIGGPAGGRVPSRLGGRQPAYCTGAGKAILAFADADRLAEVLAAAARPHPVHDHRRAGAAPRADADPRARRRLRPGGGPPGHRVRRRSAARRRGRPGRGDLDLRAAAEDGPAAARPAAADDVAGGVAGAVRARPAPGGRAPGGRFRFPGDREGVTPGPCDAPYVEAVFAGHDPGSPHAKNPRHRRRGAGRAAADQYRARTRRRPPRPPRPGSSGTTTARPGSSTARSTSATSAGTGRTSTRASGRACSTGRTR
nr:helix-turn-helix domain-containing protein [Actinomadura sp. CNU-125]